MTSTTTSTHELFLQGVRDLVIDHSDLKPEQVAALRNTKLVYGLALGGGYRGVTVYGAWKHGHGDNCQHSEIVEISALAEESWVQLAGTTIHELAHVLAGHGHGHDTEWKDLAVTLGFTKRPAAAGQVYHLAMIRPALRLAIARLAAHLADGEPAFAMLNRSITPRPCSAGVGVKGGKSRGAGSGSRMRLWECQCPKPVKVRVASDTFSATCNLCGCEFERRS